MASDTRHEIYSSLKDKSKVGGDVLTRLPLKLTENSDVGEIVIGGL